MATTKSKKTVRIDAGYMETFLPPNIRGRMSNYSSEMMSGNYLISQPILQSMYIHNGFARLICDKPAEEMTRAGFTIKELPEEVIQSIKAKLEELDAVKHFNNAFKWRRAFGGALIVVGLIDGGNLETELNENRVSDIEFMRVYDSFECTVSSRFDNPNDKRYGDVEFWQISPKTGGTSYLVHSSRTLIFDGESVPNDVRISNNGWGSSIIQNCFKQLIDLSKAYKWALLLLERSQQAVHGIPELSEQVSTPEGEAAVTKRIGVVDTVRGALNTVVIDAQETYEVKNASLTGVSDIIDKYAEALSAVSSIASFILMGKSVTGLNNGDSSKKGWNNQVEAWQNDQYRKPLDKLIGWIRLTESGGATDGGKYTIDFNPLDTPSEAEQATIDLNKEQADQAKATTLQTYANLGAIDADEIREIIRDTYNLKGDAPEPEDTPSEPMVLNPGQKIVNPEPGESNPVGNK